MNKTKVGILIFNEVEVLDFAGPFEETVQKSVFFLKSIRAHRAPIDH